jgi:hypothetical protein
MSLDSFVSRIIPAVVGYATGGGPGAVRAAVVTEQKKKQERQQKQRFNEAVAERQKNMETSFGTGRSTFNDPYQSQLVVNQGNPQDSGGFFGTLRSGLREVGGFVQDAFSSGIPQLFGVNRPRSAAQGPAITTVTNVGAQESQGSGSIQAGMGALLPNVLGGARSLLKSPLGQIALGGGGALAFGSMGGTSMKPRITRKMKSQARMVLNLAQGNISVAADILNISEDMLITILLKRFRNDGPVVTKAALRKTKQTVRRLKNMCDMYDSLRPTATRRRAPMKRASTTLISNK